MSLRICLSVRSFRCPLGLLSVPYEYTFSGYAMIHWPSGHIPGDLIHLSPSPRLTEAQLSRPLVADRSNTCEETPPHFPGPAPPFLQRASLQGFRSLSKGAQHLSTAWLPVPALGSGCFSFVFPFSFFLFSFLFLEREDALTVDSPQPCFRALSARRLVGFGAIISLPLATPGSAIQPRAHVTDTTRRLIFSH